MDEMLQQMKMALESQMSCEVEVVGDAELSLQIEVNGETKTYSVKVSED